MVFSYVQNEQQSAQYLGTHSSINLEYELKSLRDVIHQKEMLLTDGRKPNWHFTYQEIGGKPFQGSQTDGQKLKNKNKNKMQKHVSLIVPSELIIPFTSIAAVQGRQERKERGAKKLTLQLRLPFL